MKKMNEEGYWSKEIIISFGSSDEECIGWRHFVYWLQYGIWWKDHYPDFRLPENVAELIKERMIAK